MGLEVETEVGTFTDCLAVIDSEIGDQTRLCHDREASLDIVGRACRTLLASSPF